MAVYWLGWRGHNPVGHDGVTMNIQIDESAKPLNEGDCAALSIANAALAGAAKKPELSQAPRSGHAYSTNGNHDAVSYWLRSPVG